MKDIYFRSMQSALAAAGVFRPALVIDRDRLDGNISLTMRSLQHNLALRIVDKSLPSIPLLSHVLQATGARRIMSFHIPVTSAILSAFSDVDVLYGKPMPVEAVAAALAAANPLIRQGLIERTTWLVDTSERLAAYADLATNLSIRLRIAFEVDVGVHRGGIANSADFAKLLKKTRSIASINIEGIMAYEAHIPQIPAFAGGPSAELRRVKARFSAFSDCLAKDERTILNTGGSKTALLYGAANEANDLSMGSVFLLPSDFDMPGLPELQPAAFIAAPVLKVVDARVPGPPALTRLLQSAGLFPRRNCYLYGGAWMAKPVYPHGVSENRIWGRSSNQQFMAIPEDSALAVGDVVFLRPTQSEAVLQQFGPLQVYSQGQIVDEWPVLPMG